MVVISLVTGSIWANWYYSDEINVLIRALALVVVAVFAGFIGIQTEKGKSLWTTAREARSEIRRVVWPTRQETIQTTAIVILLMIVFSLILWGLDSFLSWLVKSIIG
ncbi:MAG: preprotein translocase subunit SecE [Pseudomonadota bacterium]|nr:preprotein translocase subunit SecE [Pseudomonadota bacterium]